MSFFDVELIASKLLPREEAELFIDIGKDKRQISDGVRARLDERAKRWDNYIHADYADSYGEFARNGNRSNFEDLYINRRAHLADIAFYEIFIGGVRHIEKIRELVELICNEDIWCVPAHNNVKVASGHIIELYSSETASVLSFVSYFLKDQLSESLRELIANKVEERMFTPYTETDAYWWMGTNGWKVNNWNPWINSNVMFCAFLVCKDDKRYKELVLRAVSLTENYIRSNSEDCTCDEGVRYWNLSGACLFDVAEMIYDLCGGAVDITKTPQVKGACDYMLAMYDEYGNPANYADASVDFYPDCALLFRAGERTENETLKIMGAALYRNDMLRVYHDNFYRQLKDIYTASQIGAGAKCEYPQYKLLKSINVCTMRKNGFFLSFKGNHNDERHNHNDVGSFVLYYNGTRLFIDPGVDLYSGVTFSKKRYDLWYMRSDYHNLPTVSGEVQKAGECFKATPLETGDMYAETDISAAYGIQDAPYIRSVDFSGDEIIISDISKSFNENVLNYMLEEMPRIEGNTLIFDCGVRAELIGVSNITAEYIDITGVNPPDGISTDVSFRKCGERSYLIPRLFAKQWNRESLVRICAKPEAEKVVLKISKI